MAQTGCKFQLKSKVIKHNAAMCTLSLYDVIGLTRHLHIKLRPFSNIAQPMHKEAVHDCSFLYIIAKKSVIMSEAFLVDVSIYCYVQGYQSTINNIVRFYSNYRI